MRAGLTVAGLSRTQVQILYGVALGLQDKQIARKMNVSTATVKTHLKRVYRVWGVLSRTEAVSVAYQRRVLRVAGDFGRCPRCEWSPPVPPAPAETENAPCSPGA